MLTPQSVEVSFAAQHNPPQINVTAPSGCSWTAKSNDVWVTISFGGSGNGNGSIGYNVTANSAYTQRTTTITITPGTGTAVNFTVIQDPLTFTISGFLTPAISGVPIQLSGSMNLSTTTDSGGNYSFSGLTAGGTYTVTPTLAGYVFGPLASQTFTNLTASQQGVNFTDALGKSTISGQVTVNGVGLGNVTINVNGPQNGTATTDASGKFSISLFNNSTYTVSADLAGYSFSAPFTFPTLQANQTANFTGISVAGLEFYPISPCRLVDTRVASFPPGFGPPSMKAGETRAFAIPLNPCAAGLANPQAYSLNITVVTKGYLGILSVWPAGESMPNASTLNSYSNTSTAVANAAIVPAGTNGAIDVYVTDATDLIMDINGYFGAPLSTGMQFYPVAPCRLVDTRLQMQATFGQPSMVANGTRTFTIPNNTTCNIPGSAQAYSLNVTAVPGPAKTLGFLSIWPSGQPLPNVSTLNVYTPGTVVANAAIVPAGTNGGINAFVTDPTDLVIDIDGYFAPATSTGLNFYPATPCRIADTRVSAFASALGPPSMTAGSQRSFPVPASPCGIPGTAGAYSFNFTAVPGGSQLGIFTTWPTGQSQPNVSTMNSYNGSVVSNAAIVPAGTAGAISIWVTDNTDVLFDVNGYFAK